MKKVIFHKTCPICGEHFETTVRHQKYCTEVCRLTKAYNEQNWHRPPMKRAPQWWLDRRLGSSLQGSQDDVYLEAFRICLKEEAKKIKDAGISLDLSKIEFDNVRLHSAQRNWGYCYYPCSRDRTKAGVILPAGKYCFAFNRRLMKHSVVAYRETVMHELLHVAAHQFDKVRGRGHGRLWKALVEKINRTYGYHVSHYATEQKFETLDKAACSM